MSAIFSGSMGDDAPTLGSVHFATAVALQSEDVPKRVKFFFCGAGRKRKSMGPGKPPRCLPKGVPTKTGAAKIRDMMGRRKAQKTKKALGPAYKKRVAFKHSIAMQFRKKQGIRNYGKSA